MKNILKIPQESPLRDLVSDRQIRRGVLHVRRKEGREEIRLKLG